MLFLIAFSLSMDAFSLALAYGTLGDKSINFKMSFIVGLFHFVMPLIGLKIGCIVNFNSNFLVFIILLFIGLQMVYESFKKEDFKSISNYKEMCLFAFAVSIDSFSVGIGLNLITKYYLLGAILFSAFSFSLTYLGLILGNKINHIFGRISTITGGLILIMLGVTYLF